MVGGMVQVADGQKAPERGSPIKSEPASHIRMMDHAGISGRQTTTRHADPLLDKHRALAIQARTNTCMCITTASAYTATIPPFISLSLLN